MSILITWEKLVEISIFLKRKLLLIHDNKIVNIRLFIIIFILTCFYISVATMLIYILHDEDRVLYELQRAQMHYFSCHTFLLDLDFVANDINNIYMYISRCKYIFQEFYTYVPRCVTSLATQKTNPPECWFWDFVNALPYA